MRIYFSELAYKRLFEIHLYYKINISETVAIKLKARIISRIKILRTNPLAGSEEKDLKFLKQHHRKLIAGNYKIIYRVFENYIYIDTIFDSRQSPGKLKKEMK